MIKKENTYLPTKLAHHFDGQVGMGISLDWFWKLDVRKILSIILSFFFVFNYGREVKNDSIGKIYVSNNATVFIGSETTLHGEIIHLKSETSTNFSKDKPEIKKTQDKKPKVTKLKTTEKIKSSKLAHFLPCPNSNSFSSVFSNKQYGLISFEQFKSRVGKIVIYKNYSTILQSFSWLPIQKANTYVSIHFTDYLISKNRSVRPPPSLS